MLFSSLLPSPLYKPFLLFFLHFLFSSTIVESIERKLKQQTKENHKCLKELRLGRDKLSRKQSLLMNRTLHYASQSECHQRHGAIVVKSGRVISTSCNKNNNNPAHFCDDLFNDHRKYISTHAEVAALKGVSPDQAKGAVVYVGRLLRSGEPGLSKPCPECTKVLNDMGVKKVVYT